MLVWSNIFNIAFVSAIAALTVFFLVSTIVVAAKGKRKCNAFDVILRILSTLVFIASTAMLAAAVLMMISGSFSIAIVADVPLLVVGETVTELPLPELFVALSSSIGLMLVALLFICSLAALIVDCLVANKKTKKVKKQPVQKTPEQLKREAELEKIRRIGEDAVKRADHAAKYAEPSSKKKAAQKAQPQAQAAAQPQAQATQAQAAAQPQAQATQAQTTKAAAVEQPKQPEPETEPTSDWRVKTEPEGPTEFVGLSKTNDPDFDTFDSFDDDGSMPTAEETDDIIVTERDLEPEQSEAIEDDFAAQEQAEVEPEQEQYEQDEYSQDEAQEPEQVEDEVAEDEFEEVVDGQEYSDEYNGETVDTEDDELDQAEDYVVEADDYADTSDDQPETEEQIEQVEDEFAEDEYAAEEEVEPELDREQYAEPEQEPEVEEKPQEKPIEDEYEPDRDIYIPRIRTIVRNNGNVEPAEKPKKATKSTGKSQAGKKPAAAKKTTAAKSAAKPAAKKPAAKNTSTAKKSAPKKSAATAAAPKNTKQSATTIPPEKKLPITRRYVILDRRNAVNMFGEYLKDRNQAQKDKLKSSINTIIIE